MLPSEMRTRASRWPRAAAFTIAAISAFAFLTTAVPAGASPAKRAAPKQLYVSLGDSYATGYQATGRGEGGETRNGFVKLEADGTPRLIQTIHGVGYVLREP